MDSFLSICNPKCFPVFVFHLQTCVEILHTWAFCVCFYPNLQLCTSIYIQQIKRTCEFYIFILKKVVLGVVIGHIQAVFFSLTAFLMNTHQLNHTFLSGEVNCCSFSCLYYQGSMNISFCVRQKRRSFGTCTPLSEKHEMCFKCIKIYWYIFSATTSWYFPSNVTMILLTYKYEKQICTYFL